MASYKTVTEKCTLAGCISNGYSELQSLRDEMREWADNLENGNLGHTDKFSQVEECADGLDSEADNEPSPELPATLDDLQLEVSVQVSSRKGRGASRSVRCGNACAYLQAVCDELEGRINDADEEPEEDENGNVTDKAREAAEAAAELKESLEELRDHLQETIGNVEGLDFPGMYG